MLVNMEGVMDLRRLRVLLLLVVVCFAFAPQQARSNFCGPTSVTTCPGTCVGGGCTDYGGPGAACKLTSTGCYGFSCFNGCP